MSAARSGRVPVHLVSNFSEKNPLETLPSDATVLSLLELFSRGTHRVSTTSTSTVLDAMRLMSEEGVSSVAVIDDESGTLISAVSVTDVGKILVPSQSKQILTTPLHLFISHIKESDGSTDGADKYPVYSVSPSSPLSYTIQKLLATNAHRLFVTTESRPASPITYSAGYGGISGIVSIVDILSLFARFANISDIDPTRMQRHRRASSQSSMSERDLFMRSLSRSSSRSSISRSGSIIMSSPLPIAGAHPRNHGHNVRSSISSIEALREGN
ncbi:hypothetical protein H0H81_000571 [Sphagnurus paluster]|uniref:CBS domain-containing protein n=1 Tax=Sphagnurus paluster TaxID=117069 RepID=A0A9P7FXT9_9AGAR|nr:hypothetical protein H0H81_000571 [Sphagnurus paluster]